MRIAILGKNFDNSYFSSIHTIFNTLKTNGAEILILEKFYTYLHEVFNYAPPVLGTFTSHEVLENDIDYFFSIGGDGTFLDAVTYARNSGVPIVGFNSGRLGFLADISKEQVAEGINAIFAGRYSLEKRTLLQLRTEKNAFNDFCYALNDLTVHKRDSSSMITIHMYIEDKFLNTYWADGLIVATPTGSTAYSLSAGGPVVVPNTENFVITPLAPHNLTIRPIIVSNQNKIKLKVETRSVNFLLSLDSRSEVFDHNITIEIAKADFTVNILKLNDYDFFKTLRNKLMWGADKRN